VSVPDCNILTLGAAHLIFAAVADNTEKGTDIPKGYEQVYDLFDETSYDSTGRGKTIKPKDRPEIAEVYSFLDKVFNLAQYSAECIVYGQVLLNRFNKITGEELNMAGVFCFVSQRSQASSSICCLSVRPLLHAQAFL